MSFKIYDMDGDGKIGYDCEMKEGFYSCRRSFRLHKSRGENRRAECSISDFLHPSNNFVSLPQILTIFNSPPLPLCILLVAETN